MRYSGVQPGGGGGHVGKMSIGPFCHWSPSPEAPAPRFFSARRSYIVEIHKDLKL